MGLSDKFKQGLHEARQLLDTDIRDMFNAEGRLVDEQFLGELFEALARTGMGIEAAQRTIDNIRDTFGNRVVRMEEIVDQIKQQLKSALPQPPD